jgi:ribosomal protein S18 acetylase RimI-like enzyme
MDNLTVRESSTDDIPSLAKIQVETWQYAYKGQLPDDFLKSLSVEEKQKKWTEIPSHPLPKAKVFVGVADHRIVGYCTMGASRDDDAGNTVGELMAIYTDTDFMNQGIGSALMAEGLAYLKATGFKQATLWVLTSNQKTRHFYEHKGWSADGRTKTDQKPGFALHETRYTINLE